MKVYKFLRIRDGKLNNFLSYLSTFTEDQIKISGFTYITDIRVDIEASFILYGDEELLETFIKQLKDKSITIF